MPPTESDQTAKPDAQAAPGPREYPNEALCEAAAYLHRDQGRLKNLKVVGDVVNGVNGRGQLVVTPIGRARRHAEYLDRLPKGHPDLEPPGAPSE